MRGRLKDPGMSLPGTYSLATRPIMNYGASQNLPAQESNSKQLSRGFSSAAGSRPENPKQTLAAGLFGREMTNASFGPP
jgi:hypothetical protein